MSVLDDQRIRRKCNKCNGAMTHTRLFWRRINFRMQCPYCRAADTYWSPVK